MDNSLLIMLVNWQQRFDNRKNTDTFHITIANRDHCHIPGMIALASNVAISGSNPLLNVLHLGTDPIACKNIEARVYNIVGDGFIVNGM
jgi:hypothetical protein